MLLKDFIARYKYLIITNNILTKILLKLLMILKQKKSNTLITANENFPIPLRSPSPDFMPQNSITATQNPATHEIIQKINANKKHSVAINSDLKILKNQNQSLRDHLNKLVKKFGDTKSDNKQQIILISPDRKKAEPLNNTLQPPMNKLNLSKKIQLTRSFMIDHKGIQPVPVESESQPFKSLQNKGYPSHKPTLQNQHQQRILPQQETNHRIQEMYFNEPNKFDVMEQKLDNAQQKQNILLSKMAHNNEQERQQKYEDKYQSTPRTSLKKQLPYSPMLRGDSGYFHSNDDIEQSHEQLPKYIMEFQQQKIPSKRMNEEQTLVQRLQAKIRQLQASLNQANKLNKNIIQQNNLLRTQFSNRNKKVESQTQHNLMQSEQIQELNQMVSKLSDEKMYFENQSKNLKLLVAEQNKRLKENQDERMEGGISQKKENKNLKEALDKCSIERDNLKVRNESLMEQIYSLKRKYDQLLLKLLHNNNQQSTNNEYTIQNMDAYESIRYKQQNQQLSTKNKQMQNELQEIRAELEKSLKLVSINEELMKEIENYKKIKHQVQKNEEENTKLITKFNTLAAQIILLQNQNKKLKEINDHQTNQLSKAFAELNQLKEALSSMSFQTIEENVKNMKQKEKSIELENVSNRKTLKKYQSQINRLKSMIEALRREVVEQHQINVNLREENRKISSVISHLENQKKSLQIKSVSLNEIIQEYINSPKHEAALFCTDEEFKQFDSKLFPDEDQYERMHSIETIKNRFRRAIEKLDKLSLKLLEEVESTKYKST